MRPSITACPMPPEDTPSTSRSYAWCYTLNNYTDEDVCRLETVEAVRHVCAREEGESGTKHLQGYLRFKQPKRFSWFRNQFPRMHVEMRRGTEIQAVEYCLKDGDILIDVGSNEVPVVSKKRDLEAAEIISDIENGENYGQIRKKHKVFCFWHRRNVLDYLRDHRHYQDGHQDDPSL